MAKKLVIVESPTKAKKLKAWLGKDYMVESSVGHVRDLPAGDRHLPDEYKGRKGVKHCILIENGFTPIYVPTERGRKVISDLRKKLKDADVLYLATDPDREGESISWHLREALAPKVPVKRVAFNEITKKAVEAAFEQARNIDEDLVAAQETRRILDRLVGYELSPLLWRKISPGLSAGRVQSVAVRLLVERERERMRFHSASYWDLKAQLAKQENAFEANLFRLDGQEVATTANAKSVFDETTGKVKKPGVTVLDEAQAKALKARLEDAPWRVADVEEQRRTSRPLEPFITDTLMAAANSRLGLSARDAMRTAQSLYENGWITYHRTDSPSLSEEGTKGARDAVAAQYGNEYLHASAREYSAKKGSAQEAHEAIRPAGESFAQPGRTGLSGRELALYTEIYRRTLASQMKDEEYTSTTILIEVEDAVFKATGKRVDFAGWRKAYGYDEEQDKLLPSLASGDALSLRELEAIGHETKPPARYTEGSLIKALKDDGVGRPSTYQSIIDTILGKGYGFRQGRALVPTFTAFAVTRLLEENFEALADEGFTAEMERALDEIADGKVDWQEYLDRFWHGPKGLEAQVAGHAEDIDAKATSEIEHPKLAPAGITLRVGRYGPYAEVQRDGETVRANIPPETPPADLDLETVESLLKQAQSGPEALGEDPDTGQKVYLLVGRFGPYVQLGETPEAEGKKGRTPKPPRASLPRDWEPSEIRLEDALFLLKLPKQLGTHPEGGKVLVGLGRFGPYVCREDDEGNRDFRSLKDVRHMKDLALDEALEILSQPKGRRGATRGAAKVLKELGTHPETGKKVQILDGRYGPYVKHEKTNATLPKDTDPTNVDLDQAVALIAEKAARGGSKKRTAKRATKRSAKRATKRGGAKRTGNGPDSS